MAQKRHIASWAARRKMQGVAEALTSTWRTVTVEDRFVKELSRQPEIGSAYSHHAPWHVAPDGGYGSRSQWQQLISLMLGILALLFLVPALFIIFQWLQERLMPRKMVA